MFSRPSTIRAFSTVAPLRSKIGGMPISLPPTVKLTKIAPTPRPGRKQDMGTMYLSPLLRPSVRLELNGSVGRGG